MAEARSPDNPFSWLGGRAVDAPMAGDIEADLAAQGEMLRQMAQSRLNFAMMVADVFNAGRGPELMDALIRRTLDVSLMDISGSLVRGEVALSPAEWAYVREGQNSVIRFLRDNIEFAANPPADVVAALKGE